MPCRAGCSACCHGPFDISAADARLVAQAVALLPPTLQDDVHARAARQLDAGTRVVPGWRTPWHVGELGDAAFDVMCDGLEQDPCPALDPGTQACLIHADRPATCRLMGLSVRTSEGDILENPCPIQGEFPGYGNLAPTPFDLMEFEVDAARCDMEAMAAGWHSTTVAGAVERERARKGEGEKA